MASQSAHAGKKRRADGPPSHRSAPKRRKPDIPVQNPRGEVNIAKFVKAREFEINALEKNMRDMRKTLNSRAFQQVPRHMRRRTASHNVKKVPRRLRKRALREMREDKTPTVNKRTRATSRKLRLRLETAKSLKALNQRSKTVGQKKKDAKVKATAGTDPDKKVEISRIPKIRKNVLAKPPTATTKYKRRQVNKTWLPTHLWHSKRAHMTRPTEPLWRLAIPLRPTEKSYRPTHRASSVRGCIAWDTSYMSTVACLGTEHTLGNLLKALRFELSNIHRAKGRKWRQGSRFAEGTIHEVDGMRRLLGPASVIWMPSRADKGDTPGADAVMSDSMSKSRKIKLDKRIFIRVHPSCFKDFWSQLLKAAKSQKPQVLVEDLRFEIGSIRVTGPASTESLVGVLKSRHDSGNEHEAAQLWSSLAGLTNPGTLPERAILPLNIVDPRLSHPPQRVKAPQDADSLHRLNELICAWPLDQKAIASELGSHKARWIAGARLPSQKSINRRRAQAGPGKRIPVLEKDPSIPTMLLAHRAHGASSGMQGSWEVLLPWPCVDAVWRSLMYYPVSTGNTPRFGGLSQTRQVAFEQLEPWFPADMPGTEAGKAWERTQSENRFDAWLRRPPGRRMRWELVDLGLSRMGEVGRGWCCDWEYLFKGSGAYDGKPKQGAIIHSSGASTKQVPPGGEDRERSRRRNTSSPETTPEPETTAQASEPSFYQLPANQAAVLLDPADRKPKNFPALDESPILATVRIRLLTKGTPAAGARIYRLPQLEPLLTITHSLSTLPSATAPATASSGSVTQSASNMLPPSLPASAIAHTSTQPTATGVTSTTTSTPSTKYPHAPPAAQPDHPSPQAFTSTSTSTTNPRTHRTKWLSLVPPTYYTSTPSHHPPPNTTLPALPPNPLTHPSLPDAHALHALSVLPRNATAEIVETYTPRALTVAEHAMREAEVLRAEGARGDLLPVDLGDAGGEQVDRRWDVRRGLVECPDAEDLVGFVTSGGYSLVEGRGAGVGAVWVQRVREGWRREDDVVGLLGGEDKRKGKGKEMVDGKKGQGRGNGKEIGTGMGMGKGKGSNSGVDKEREQRVRERRLCVVRNAGESVGRLGWWEVCV